MYKAPFYTSKLYMKIMHEKSFIAFVHEGICWKFIWQGHSLPKLICQFFLSNLPVFHKSCSCFNGVRDSTLKRRALGSNVNAS